MTFRIWLQEMWFAHQAELESYGQPLRYDLKEYFTKYKYWLKREFRHQQGAK
jgi:hypothetical protein